MLFKKYFKRSTQNFKKVPAEGILSASGGGGGILSARGGGGDSKCQRGGGGILSAQGT